MKTNKKLGFFAAALTALACALPCATRAAGDIWSIEPYSDSETVYDVTDMKGSKLVAGDVFKIRMRLLNRNWATWIAGTSTAQPWSFMYDGPAGSETIATTSNFLPKLGLWMNGRLVYAELTEVKSATGSETSDKVMFTDLIFAYTVEAGDLGLPIKLANPSGTGPIDTDQQISGEYYLFNGRGWAKNEYWALKNDAGDQASFTFSDIGSVPGIRDASGSSPNRHWDFSDPGIYVQAVDFDDHYVNEEEGIWRSVPAGETATEPSEPSLKIDGGAGSKMDLYVWTEDSSVAIIKKGGDVEEPVAYTDPIAGKTYMVGRIRIPAGSSKPEFRILGCEGQVGRTTKIFLAPTCTNVYDKAQNLVTNFLTRVVKVTQPLEPRVIIQFADGASPNVTADVNYVESKTILNVRLSRAFTENVEVTIKPELVAPVEGISAWKYIGLSNYKTETDPNAYMSQTVRVVIPANQTTATLPNIYLYALGADANTQDIDKGIIFRASLENSSQEARDFFTGDFVDAVVRIMEGKPVVSVDSPITQEVQGGEDFPFTVHIADSFLGEQGTYNVFWSEDGLYTSYQQVMTNAVPTGGVFIVKHNYGRSGTDINSKVYVQSADGRLSNEAEFTISKVAGKKKIRAAFLGDKVIAEGGKVELQAQLEPAWSSFEDGYVFIRALTPNATNYIDESCFSDCVTIGQNSTTASPNFTLKAKDGCKITEDGLKFEFVIRSEPSLETGKELKGYVSDPFMLQVTNIVPEVELVQMGIHDVADGETVEVPASVGVRKLFTMTPKDEEAKKVDFEAGLDENGEVVDLTQAFLARWTFYDGAGYSTNVYGSPYQEVPYTFVNSGKIKVTVELQDKDLRKKGQTKFGPKYTFFVNVIDSPALEVTSNTSTISEGEKFGPQSPTFTLHLTGETPHIPIDVKVVLKRAGADNGNYPVPQLSGLTPVAGEPNAYIVRFDKNMTEKKLWFNNDFDGTEATASEGILVTAEVLTDAPNMEGIPYNQLYRPLDDSNGFGIYIENKEPEVVIPRAADTNITFTTLSEQQLVEWRVSDVCKVDLTNEYHGAGWGGGLKVIVQNDEGASMTFWTRTGSGTYTNTFKAAGGGKFVSVVVEDKDGYQSQVVKKYYEIKASKGVYIYPQRPYRGGGQSDLSIAYLQADGVGYGRVWAEVSANAKPSIKNFRHFWTYSEGISTAILGASGYHPGDIDDGTLDSGMGVGITMDGVDLKAGLTPYKYAGNYDNFLYAWIVDAADESSTFTGTATLSPQIGSGAAEKIFSLPEDEDDAESYVDTVIEAIFSREYLLTDNMGDINQDGIPDVFAVRRYDAGILYELAGQNGGSAGGGEGSVDVSDLKNAWSYNGDGDMLPQAFMYSNPLKPTMPGWGPWTDFKAGWEIRGLHDGLNYPGISDPDFSQAETLALICDYLKAGNPNKDTYAELLADALAWAKEKSWNLERRTDPTVADTDADGYDDGWEYFFWYYAKAGTVVDGQWRRLTGSRFNMATPGKGTPIPSEQIAAAFDPLARHPDVQISSLEWDVKDFDGDGLTDLEEYALGTNPVDWDSDGDGASDYFEVMNGTDPLNAADGNGNPDGDFMAYMTSTDKYTIARVWDDEAGCERVFAYPVEEGGIAVENATDENGDEVSVDVWEVKFDVAGQEKTYYLKEEPVTVAIPEWVKNHWVTNVLLGVSTEAYRQVLVGEGDDATGYLGELTTLEPGIKVLKAADAAVTVNMPATSSFTGGLELFRYGGDADGVWVPCAVDGQTMVEFVDDEGEPVERALVIREYVAASEIVYLHHQVYQVAGFDPRTGWYNDGSGFVAQRWHVLDSEKEGGEAGTGLAVNTKAYTTRDEFLLLSYRYNVHTVTNKAGQVIEARAHRNAEEDVRKIDNYEISFGNYLQAYTTKATAVKETSLDDNMDGGANSNAVATASSEVHGADTDVDGIPDGWELYVNLDPNVAKDSAWVDDPLADSDELLAFEEFAGTDSCNAYKDVPSIYTNHPGIVKGWYNKFFPTDPMDSDTDGDGLTDKQEGSSWGGNFYVGRDMTTASFTFIYGSNTAYAADMSTKCFRGGGLNPCTVDTDMDLLPDPWEYEFAGILMDETGNNSKLTEANNRLLRRGDGLAEGATPNGVYISGGMDGTWSGDAYGRVHDSLTGTTRNTDWDHDGLQNYQEYLVQSLRHLRYDDAETPLMGRYLVWQVQMGAPLGIDTKVPFMGFTPMQAWDGEAFFRTCIEAGYKGNNTTFDYAKMGYFARPPKAWDRLAQNTGGAKCSNYAEAGYRVMLRPQGLAEESGPDDGESSVTRYVAKGYASTDPRRWDSDDDGMDDYYELFHGLNPLLGSNQDPSAGGLTTSTPTMGNGGSGVTTLDNSKYDRIATIYGGKITSWKNAWTFWQANGRKAPEFDPIKYPWMMGTAECDADGDGLRNSEEALTANLTSPATTHTDPTPLWFTDSTSTNLASYTAQYYRFDPTWGKAADLARCWDRTSLDLGNTAAQDGYDSSWMFAFEENEGYDTDHDFIKDSDELVKRVTPASDPLAFTDPDRRQAMWFPGEESAVVSTLGTQQRPNALEYDFLRQFTAEAWIRPERLGVDQIILERVSNYGGSTLSNAADIVRANFRIGVNADNCVYGEYEGSTIDSGYVRVVGLAIEADTWTHVALTYNGSELRLYMNGDPSPVAKVTNAGLIPANGVTIMLEESQGDSFPMVKNGYATVPSAFILGATALSGDAIELTAKSTWANYGKMFAGYIDEVRVWDGARSGPEINEAYKMRYSLEDVKAIRANVYAGWRKGSRRNNTTTAEPLPCELLQHYSFMALPGELDPLDVLTEPTDFKKNVLDNVRVNGALVDLRCGWWASLPVHSTVYDSYAVVPWIQNTVGHLPRLDGSVLDSMYWTEDFAGVSPAAESGVSRFVFPNSANPYPYWTYFKERVYQSANLASMGDRVSENTFDLRSGFIGTSDLVPLGGAFTKRVEDMWDGNGAADAWVVSKYDFDGDGLPDWWEEAYGDPDQISWDSDIVINGRTYKAWELYLRDLAKGLLVDGSFDDAYAANGIDADKDGLPDWWEDLYGIQGTGDADGDALADNDNDQLSNWAEFFAGEALVEANYAGFKKLDPTAMRTDASNGQVVPDYFLKVGKLYLGEMLTDHDFMEDWWERLYAPSYVSMFVHDGLMDPDDDGWSNYSECRAGTDPTVEKAVSFVSADIAEYPIPTIRAKFRYYGKLEEKALVAGNLVVKAFSAAQKSIRSSAEWTIAISGKSDSSSSSSGSSKDSTTGDIGAAYTRHLGRNPGGEVTFNLGNGKIVPGTLSVSFRDLNALQVSEDGSSLWLAAGGTSWCTGLKENFTGLETDSADLTAGMGEIVGRVDYKTGDVTIDFSKIPDYLYKLGESKQGQTGGFTYTYGYPGVSNAYERIYIPSSYVKIDWNGQIISSDHFWSMNLTAADRGHLREGDNYFEAFLDMDGNGEWTPGEPYGCATEYPVDVSWSSRDIEFELTDTAPQTFRINLAQAVEDNTFESQTLMTDRGVNANGANIESRTPGTNMPSASATDVRVCLALTQLNGKGAYQAQAGGALTYPNLVAFDGKVNLAALPLFSEANILKGGDLDLGWGQLGTQATRLGLQLADVTSAAYRLVLGDGTVASAVTNNNLATIFVNVYEKTRTATVPFSPRGTIYSAQPTFKWKHENGVKSYPAFRLRVWKAGTETIVYDSGAQRAPARDFQGYYSWTAPIYANMATPNGVVFATTNNYEWAVSMLDAKFTSMGTSETKKEFRLECSGEGGGVSDYGSIDVAVKYFGPANMSFTASKPSGLVHVQAFTTPDFSGAPVGEIYPKGGMIMTNAVEIAKNCTIQGLPAGTYYIRAFIDTNGNGKKEAWETWGYVNYVGTEAKSVYNPKPVVVKAGSVEKPFAVLYMEDMDYDRDTLPDVYEYDTKSSLSQLSSVTGNSFFTRVNPQLKTVVNAYSKIDLPSVYLQSTPFASMLQLDSGLATKSSIAAANLLAGEELVKENVYVSIASFSLTDGISVDVASEVTAGGSDYIVVNDAATVGVYLVASDSLDFANATVVKVKDITITANKTCVETISAEELARVVEANGLGAKAYLKVRLAK